MATIIVEDGTGKTDSNSYVSEADVTTYATDRGVTLTADADILIIKAMDYLETLDYIGTKFSQAQALQWPRNNVYIDGYYIEPSTIPQELKNSQMALCLSIDAGADPMATTERATKKEKVDTIEIEYMDNAATKAIITSVNRALNKLLKSGSMGSNFNVDRS